MAATPRMQSRYHAHFHEIHALIYAHAYTRMLDTLGRRIWSLLQECDGIRVLSTLLRASDYSNTDAIVSEQYNYSIHIYIYIYTHIHIYTSLLRASDYSNTDAILSK